MMAGLTSTHTAARDVASIRHQILLLLLLLCCARTNAAGIQVSYAIQAEDDDGYEVRSGGDLGDVELGESVRSCYDVCANLWLPDVLVARRV